MQSLTGHKAGNSDARVTGTNESDKGVRASYPTSFGESNVDSMMNPSRQDVVEVEEAAWTDGTAGEEGFWDMGVSGTSSMVNRSEYPSLSEVLRTSKAAMVGSNVTQGETTFVSGVTGNIGGNTHGNTEVTGQGSTSTAFVSNVTQGRTEVTGNINNTPSFGSTFTPGDGVSVAPKVGRMVSSTSHTNNEQATRPNSPSKGKPTDSNPIVQSVDVNTLPQSYVGVTSGTQAASAKATKPSNSTPSQGEASTSYGPIPKSVGAANANNNSKSNENSQPSQPTRNVTNSNSHPTPKVTSPSLAVNVITSNPFDSLAFVDGDENIELNDGDDEVVNVFYESGNLFNKPGASTPALNFCDTFPGSFAIFQPYRISDHSPCVLRIPLVAKLKPKPFKFSNFLVHKEGFLDTVNSGWNLNVNGCAMYRVVKRLKGLKSPFRKLLHNQGNLHERVDRIRKELDEVQKAIDKDPWGWRKLLAIRPKVRPFIWHKINNGKTTSVRFDMWCDLRPIRDMLNARDIVRAGLSLSDSVYDVIDNGTWRWSADWLSRFPNLVNLSKALALSQCCKPAALTSRLTALRNIQLPTYSDDYFIG
ncbi:RNA-directed DNA polymerase, eukaryota, Reverse transcriptase zinc-binding domain protein [Artemisia annua]|uniref:RNA-directed DNA polymerase, eukaryota, Reverse transcriptase zinc-binding domain protein n=1 Tax=Artemisia annua TaxID=35608 RepID=A0A2U1KRZ4_ARTAN|nr:RNA-directed DNA polymerase, eukaryota, Reverse transcriptase zinc-binding domain protein [Artemisia annua]